VPVAVEAAPVAAKPKRRTKAAVVVAEGPTSELVAGAETPTEVDGPPAADVAPAAKPRRRTKAAPEEVAS
jgi:hypothetical protein